MFVRNGKGEFIRAQTVWKKGQPIPQEAEASRLRKVLLWLMNLVFTQVVIELDIKLVLGGISSK